MKRAALAIALVGATVACNVILGIGDDKFRFKAAAVEAGVGDGGPPARCLAGIVPPSLPADALDGDDLARRFTFALRRFDLSGKTADGGAAGYDLDGVCSCSENDHSVHAGLSCDPPAASTAKGCDLDHGVDNALASAGIGDLVESFGFSLDQPTFNAACGQRTVLVLLDGYNGKANDPHVSVAFVASFGIREEPAMARADAGACYPGGTVPASPGAPYPAKMDGTDVWSYRTRDYDGVVPKVNSAGWVRDYKLVLDGRSADGLDQKNLEFLIANRVVTMGSVVFTADLVPLDDADRELAIVDGGVVGPGNQPATPKRFMLRNGVISGRVEAADLLTTLGNLNVGSISGAAGKFWCKDPTFALAEQYLCAAADTMTVPKQDFTNQPCNALSFVVQFDAVPATIGKVEDAKIDEPCGTEFAATCR